MNTFEMFEILREVKAEYGMPDAYTSLFPDSRFPVASIVYAEDDEIPDLAWTEGRKGRRFATLVCDGLEISVQAPAESLWKGRDVTAAPSPNEPAKTYTYPEGDAA